MKETPRQKANDPVTERMAREQSIQSAQKSVPRQAPLKKHGQPAWRKVQPD